MAPAQHQHQHQQRDGDADDDDALADEQLPLRTRAAATDKQRASRQLLAFAARSFGPRGRGTLLQQNARCADALVLTTSAGRFLQHAAVSDCPIANVFVQMLRSHTRSHSDAGLFLTLLSTTLQLEIQGGALAELPRSSVLRGLQLARQWSLAYLDDDSSPVRIPIDWSHRPSLHAFVRGIVGSKAAAAGLSDPDAMISLVVETFVAVYAFVAQNPSEAIPVRFVFLPGHAPSSSAKSQLWERTAFLDFPWPRGFPRRPVTNATLALFNITIDPLRQEPADGVSAQHARSQEPFRLEALRRVADSLHALGVTAVMSQKIIPRFLQLYLLAKGVFVLDRLSLSHIHAVRQLSGASILGDWSVADVDPTAFGSLSLITTHEIGAKRFIRLHREHAEETRVAHRTAPICTVVLEAPDRLAFEELVYVVETALRRLAVLAERPDAVAGAGCMEIHLAAFLRQKAELLRLPAASAAGGAAADRTRTTRAQDSRALRQLRRAVEAFADCVLRVVTHLDPRCSGEEGETMLERLRDANKRTVAQSSPAPRPSQPRTAASVEQRVELFGWNSAQRSVMSVVAYADTSSSSASGKRVLRAHVLDSYASKRDALALALDCACSVAGIASVVRVS